MKIIVDLGHPAHVHLFKNFILEMEKRGHEVLITARDKEILLYLLNAYGFEYITLSKQGKNLSGLAVELLKRDYKLFKLARSYKPDILIGLSEIITHVGKLLRKPSVVFTDTEHAKLSNLVTNPFADAIITPSCYKRDLCKKQIRYNGYHELAYLHPNYFTPNPAVRDEMGLSKDDTFIILRFVSWTAGHDVGQHGIKNKIELVRELEKYGQVFITSEGQLDKDLEKYKIKVSPEKLHDLLYYASLYVGEGSTTASECAILGTHAIYVNTLRLGYTDEEEEKYSLVYNFSAEKTMEKQAFDKALELLENINLRREGKRKREKLLNDKIDVTAFMVWFIENYPESFKEMKENKRI
jgi:predicted glycosyltransferase